MCPTIHFENNINSVSVAHILTAKIQEQTSWQEPPQLPLPNCIKSRFSSLDWCQTLTSQDDTVPAMRDCRLTAMLVLPADMPIKYRDISVQSLHPGGRSAMLIIRFWPGIDEANNILIAGRCVGLAHERNQTIPYGGDIDSQKATDLGMALHSPLSSSLNQDLAASLSSSTSPVRNSTRLQY